MPISTSADARSGGPTDQQYQHLWNKLQYCEQRLAELSARSTSYPHRNNHRTYHARKVTVWDIPLRWAPKFNGNVHRYPTPEFLQDFDEFIHRLEFRYDVDDYDQREIFFMCLEGDAAQWGRVFGSKISNFYLVRLAFERRFWGPDIQRRLQQEFNFGTYRQRSEKSKMAPYYIGYLRRMQALVPDLSGSHFNYVISHHYPFHIQQLIQNQNSLDDVYCFLLEEDRINNVIAEGRRIRCQRNQRGVVVVENTPRDEIQMDDVSSENDSIAEDSAITNTTVSTIALSRSCRAGRCNGPIQVRHNKIKKLCEMRDVRNSTGVKRDLREGELVCGSLSYG